MVEAIPRGGDHYDFEARYEIGSTDFVCPADLDAGTTARAQALALDAYRVLGCYGFARVDLMLEESTGELYVLEANVIPGLTETSLLPLAAEDVIAESAIEFEHEVEDTEEVVDKFKEFLDQVSPEDFRGGEQ